MSVGVWLGSAAPTRSVRWLDGALTAASALGPVTAIAAGLPPWLDLVGDRASRAGVSAVGVETEHHLDFIGWGQLAAAIAKYQGLTTILVDEASRPERAPEVGVIAEALDAAQLTRVTSLSSDGDVILAQRTAGLSVHGLRVRGPAVIGVRIAGPAIEEYPTPTPSVRLARLALATIGVDDASLARRALPVRTVTEPHRTIERVVEHLAAHLVARGR